MKLHIILFFIAILSTGFMSGIFFTWTNAVTPGIGQLDTLGYLKSLQSMNRVILNPLFYLAFGIPVIALILSIIFGYKLMPSTVFRLVVLAGVIYIGGAFLVTLWGNIPLNNILDAADLSAIGQDDAETLRAKVEVSWNNFNLIRTVSSFVAFVLLLLGSF